MDDETPPAKAKPSQIPSWVMLGFVLGALFVMALPKREPPAAPARPAATVPTAPLKPTAPANLNTIDAVFAVWGRYAVWSDDKTEVALWSQETKSFSDDYEVIREGDETYFRPIAALTRPLLTHGVPEGSPMQFTETERQRQEWLDDVRKENWKAFGEGLRKPTDAPVVIKPNGS
jgi:hypothetical protein